jgi:hypothetical protein
VRYSVVWTMGHWRHSLVCRGRVEPCGSPKGDGLVEGVSEAAVANDRIVEQKQQGMELALALWPAA